jgi:hypothetical protein
MQSEAGAVDPRGNRTGEAPKGLKQLRQVFLGDPITVVGHVDGDPSRLLANRDGDLAPLGRIFHSVGDEVAEDRLDLLRICSDADPA